MKTQLKLNQLYHILEINISSLYLLVVNFEEI